MDVGEYDYEFSTGQIAQDQSELPLPAADVEATASQATAVADANAPPGNKTAKENDASRVHRREPKRQRSPSV